MAADELRIKAVLDLGEFNKALGLLNSGLAAVGNVIKEIGVGALRYVGELAVRAFVQAGRAAFNFARDVAGAAFENSTLKATLDDVYAGLVAVTRTSFTPLVNELNRITTQAAPAFLGVVQRAEEYLGRLATDALGYGENVASQFAQGIWDGFVYVVDALTGLGSLITYWLAPGSPPRILPELDQWGADAMSVYLAGWGNGDFSIFNKISGTLTSLIRSMADPLGTGEGVIPQILGTREGIARAVEELRRTGTVSTATLDSIIAGVGGANAEVRGYLESLIALESANADVAAAQKAVNDATAAYDALLAPIDARLGSISEAQQQFNEDLEKGRLAFTLKDPNATAAEKRQAALRIEQIDAERARRAAVAQGEAAVDAAQDQLTAAQAAQKLAQDGFDAETARLGVLAETNGLINDQIKLLDRLNEKVKEAVGGGGKGGGGGGKFKVDTSWIDDLVEKVQSKLAILQAAWQIAWALIRARMQPVWDFINNELLPLFDTLWGTISTAGSIAIQIISNWWNSVLMPMLQNFWTWSELHILPLFGKMWDWLKVKLPEAVSTAAAYFNAVLLPALLGIVTWWLTLGLFTFTSIWEWLENKLPKAGDDFAAMLTRLITGAQFFGAAVGAVFQALGESISITIGQINADIQSAIDLLWQLISLSWMPIPGHGSGTGPGSNQAAPAYIPPSSNGRSTGGSTVTNTTAYNYSPQYNSAPPSPAQDFAAMQVWGAS